MARAWTAGDRQAVERYAVPTSALDVPGQNGFVADEVDFAVGETLSSVNVSAASLDVVAANLLAERQCRKRQEYNARECKESMPHRSPRLEAMRAFPLRWAQFVRLP